MQMLRFLKKILKTLFRSRRLRDRRATPADDQLGLPDAHRNSTALSEASVTTDTEATNSLSQAYFDSAQQLRGKFPQACCWLASEDLQLVKERSGRSGRYADVWKGRLDGRVVAVKAYRCYVHFDPDWVRLVSHYYNPHRRR